jgi:diguanylate cyclase (GGDEF)-like protein/PAS domain S-box-containing protein
MHTLRTPFEKITAVRRGTPEQQRRGRLLARLIVISAVFNLVLLLANLWLWLSADSVVDQLFFFVGLIGFGLLAGVWVINRRGLVYLAAILTLSLYLGRIAIVSEPDRFANSFWAFLIPIIISSFILRPVSSFPTAGASAILYFLLSARVGQDETLDITSFKLFLLFMLAVVSYFMAAHLDRAIETVRLSEAKYRNLFDDLPIGVYRTSPEGQILDANPAFLKMFRFPDLPTLQRLNARDLYANPFSRDQYLTLVEKTTTTEMQMRKSDGTLFWATDHVHPIYDPKGDVLYYEGSLIDVSEQKKAEQELKHLAITDPLTGLPNRRHFFNQAEEVFERSNKPTFDLAILMIDIDHFKNINDRYGHGAGDIVLHEIAQSIHSNLRTNDISGRYGGEEFSVILSRINQDEICQIADRLCKTIAGKSFKVEGEKIRVTISIGVAVLDATTPTLDVLLQRADQALYVAKQAGRNCWRLWNPSLTVSI